MWDVFWFETKAKLRFLWYVLCFGMMQGEELQRKHVCDQFIQEKNILPAHIVPLKNNSGDAKKYLENAGFIFSEKVVPGSGGVFQEIIHSPWEKVACFSPSHDHFHLKDKNGIWRARIDFERIYGVDFARSVTMYVNTEI